MPLSEPTQQALERLWSAEFEHAFSVLPGTLQALSRSLAARGLNRSGAHVVGIDKAAGDLLTHVADAMFARLIEANDSEAPKNVEARITELQRVFAERLAGFHRALEEHVHALDDKLGLMMEERNRPRRVEQLARAYEYGNRTLVERIRFVVTASAKKGTPMATNINLGSHSVVGAIQTGDSAQASTSQVVQQGADFAGVVDALTQVIAAVEKTSEGKLEDRRAVAKLLDEARTEVAKPSPDKWKISGAIKGAADFVRFVPDAIEAFEKVQKLLGM